MNASNITRINRFDAILSNPKLAVAGLIGAIGLIYFYHGAGMFVFFALAYIAANLLGELLNISPRNRLTIAAALCFTLSYAMSSQALIFEGLETAMTTALAGTGDALDATVIAGFFMFVRIVIAICFIIGIVVAVSRALQGADWAPIGTALGIAVFAVVAIEMMSFMLVGGTAA